MKNMTNNLSTKILEKIEKKKIQPTSKLFFVVKNYMFWFVVVFATLLLTLLFVSLFSHIQHIDFSIAERVSGGKIQHLLRFFPYSLLLFILVMFILGIENFLHTKYAYRIDLRKIFLSIFLVSFIFGGALSFVIDSEKIENNVGRGTFGIYHKGSLRRKQMWVQPQHGLLAGSLLELSDDEKYFDFIDFSGKLWMIDISDFSDTDISLLHNSEYISMKGEQQNNNVFKACTISEWKKKMIFKKNERNYFELRSNKCN